jgi:S1-C subfamily serine protease
VLIGEIFPGGPAARAGLRVGDVVTAVGGVAVNDPNGLNFQVGTRRPGETVPLAVVRDGEPRTLNARVETPPSGPADTRTIEGANNPFGGATVANLSPAAAEEFGVDAFGSGVIITKVSGRDVAAAVGLRPGDIIRSINGEPINSTAELARAAAGYRRGSVITVVRGGREITTRI